MDSVEFNYAYAYRTSYLLDREMEAVFRNIGSDDHIVYMARGKRSGALLWPSVVIATGKRLIIVDRHVGRVKSDISFIPFQSIASVRIIHGMLFSSIRFRINGSEAGSREDWGEGQANGLADEDAMTLFSHINSILDENKKTGPSNAPHYNVHGSLANNAYIDAYRGRGDDSDQGHGKGLGYPEMPVTGTAGIRSIGNEVAESGPIGYVSSQSRMQPVRPVQHISTDGSNAKPECDPHDLQVLKARKKVDPHNLIVLRARRPWYMRLA